jgi:acylaminoacyl-peptidase
MIVHYYGGTLPMKKSFDRRLVWFAAKGYVVLMTNPAGAPGYGQAFANLHINDWGYPAGSDIIEGVEQFEKTHAYVDPKHVGNFGHSYGGFMTMHLATRTNLFATSIEIAGISNIADYWGAGWTGYSYTDGTCPGCYPWNRKDLYVDRSPLFQADKIKGPMLLIHGTDDTNVVPTESEQMFTALRMLGREAELIRFYGENHGINSRPSVTRALYGVMLDWYDKYLRDRPDAWLARWNPTGGGSNAHRVAASASR